MQTAEQWAEELVTVQDGGKPSPAAVPLLSGVLVGGVCVRRTLDAATAHALAVEVRAALVPLLARMQAEATGEEAKR